MALTEVNSLGIKDGEVKTADILDSNVTTAKLAADAVTGAKIADDAVDSEHYAADSIDAEHYAPGSVDTTALGSDAVTGAKIADDAIDSEHIAAGAVDLEHMASESVDEDNLKISNAGSNGQYLQKQSGNTGGLTWATVAATPFTRNNAFSFPNDQVSEVVDLSIPADCVEFTISFTDVSSSGNEDLCFQLGTSSGIKTSGYECKSSYINNNASPSSENITDFIRFKIDANTGNDIYGFCTFIHVNNNDWVFHGQAGSNRISDRGGLVVGQVAMGATVTTLRCRCNGDSGFDVGVGRLVTRT